MSLAIITTTNEGNTIAADSMETYKNTIGDTREGSMSRMKLFRLNSKTAAVACGLSFLENKNIHQHIAELCRKNDFENKPVSEIVGAIYDFIYEKYAAYLKISAERRKGDIEATGGKKITYTIDLECISLKFTDKNGKEAEQKYYQPIIEFLVAGYDPDGKNNVFKITIPDPKEKTGIMLKLTGDQCGATWIGQTDVLVRIIRGWSPQIKQLKVIYELSEIKKTEFMKQLDDQEYLINWGTMTMQDAIEFSDLAIRTTESIQKITDGTWMYPGSSPGVGGPIDIAVVTPDKGFAWVQKKKLHIGGAEVDL